MVLHFVMPIFYLTGFGLRVSPGGAKAFFVQYRTGEVCHTDRNRKRSLGRYPGLTPGAARRRAKALLGRTRDGRVPSVERARARGLPRVGEAMEAWLATRNIRDTSLALYRRSVGVWLKGWLGRRLDEVTREDVARCFAEVTGRHGRVKANLGLFVLGGAYRRSAIDHPGLRNPVERWKLAGGRAHRIGCRRIEHPAVPLPAWERGIRKGVRRSEARDFFRFGLYAGMRRSEVRRFAGSGCRSGRGGSWWTRPRAGSRSSSRSRVSSRRSSRVGGRHDRKRLGGCSPHRTIPSGRSGAPTANFAPSPAMAANRSGTTRSAIASSPSPRTNSSSPTRSSSAWSTTAWA